MGWTFKGELDPVAIYAALVATTVFVWNVVVWMTSGPRVRISASPDWRELTIGHRREDDGEIALFVNIAAVNTGTQPTTVVNVTGHAWESFWDYCLRRRQTSFIVNHVARTHPLPFELKVGGQFQSRLVQDDRVDAWLERGVLKLGVVHTFSAKPVWIRVKRKSKPKEAGA